MLFHLRCSEQKGRQLPAGRPFDYWAYRIKSQYASDQVNSKADRASRL